MQESNKASNTGIVNGTCNENFTKFRKYRYWDPKKGAICQKCPEKVNVSQVPSEVSDVSENCKEKKWTFKNLKSGYNNSSDIEAGDDLGGKNKNGMKFKRQLTRGSSEKMMIVNRLKKVTEQSPDRSGWRPRLSLRRKSTSLDESSIMKH